MTRTRRTSVLLLLLTLAALGLAPLALAEAPTPPTAATDLVQPADAVSLWLDLQLTGAAESDVLPVEAFAASGEFLAYGSCQELCSQRYWNCLQHVCRGDFMGLCADRCEQQHFDCMNDC